MGLYDSKESSSSSTKIILIASLLLILVAVIGLGAYFFQKKNSEDIKSFGSSGSAAHERVDALEREAEKALDANRENQIVVKRDAEASRFENIYMELDKELMAPVAGSKKIMVVKVALMTHYDQRVFDNVKKHEFAIRSAIIEVMRQTTELDATKPNFRVDLAGKIKIVMNEVLMKYEDFGGIEDVFFTSFVMQ